MPFRVKLLFLVGLLSYSLRLHAQQSMYGDEPKPFTGSLIGGVNFSQVDGDSFYGYHRVGLHMGAQVFVHFTDWLGASMELLYSQKGSRGQAIKESPTIGTFVTKYYMNLNYVEVPVTFHIITHNTDIESGVSYGRLIGAKEWLLTDQHVSLDEDANRFNNTDIDFIVGLTRKAYKQLYVNLRFQYSLTSMRPVERIPYGYSYGNLGQFNNLFNLRLIYLL